MIAHCCRFAEPYIRLKKLVESGALGRPRMASFYRMSAMPKWLRDNWLLKQDTSGGCLLDMHIHDIDIVQWVFGIPEALCAMGLNMIPGSGIDALTAQYRYADFIATAQSNWCVQGDNVPFMYGYQVAFEKGSIICRDGALTCYREGLPPEEDAEAAASDGYYGEILYFIRSLEQHKSIREANGPDSASTVHIAQRELDSIREGGAWVII